MSEGGHLRLEPQAIDLGALLGEIAQPLAAQAHGRGIASYGRRQQGSGLALALARRLVELHGGRIWVDSPGPGRGSMFSFIVPVASG